MRSTCSIVALVLGSTSCGAAGFTVDEDHSGDIYPTLRATIDLGKPDAPGQAAPTQLELQVSQTDDEAGVVDYKLFEAQLALRSNIVRTEKATLSLVYGLGFERDTLDLGAPFDGGDDIDHAALVLGLRFGYRVWNRVELYGRAQTMGYLIDEGDSNQIELGTSVRITDNIAAFVAWREWVMTSLGFVDDTNVDEVHLDTQGVAFGLEFGF